MPGGFYTLLYPKPKVEWSIGLVYYNVEISGVILFEHIVQINNKMKAVFYSHKHSTL